MIALKTICLKFTFAQREDVIGVLTAVWRMVKEGVRWLLQNNKTSQNIAGVCPRRFGSVLP